MRAVVREPEAGRLGNRLTPSIRDIKSRIAQTRALLALVLLVGTTACASTEATAAAPDHASQAPSSTDSRVTLPIGATVRLDGGTALTLRDVSDDSRCPSDATCFWAGDATLTIAVTPPKGTTEVVVLHTGLADAQSATVAGRRLTLERLEPEPTTARPVERPHYRAVLATSK